MKRAKRKVTIAVIEWLDACYEPDVSAKDDPSFGVLVTSAGALISDTPEMVRLALNWDHAPTGDDYRHVITIPKPYIKAMKRVRVEL